MLSKVESKSTISCVLLDMSSMSTLILEYEQYEYDIKISINAYKHSEIMSMTRIYSSF